MLQGTKTNHIDLLGVILVAGAGLESIMFMFFTGDFLFEQLGSVKDSQTCVESYQFKRGVTESIDQNFVNVFGKNSWLWLVPVPPDLDINYEEEVILEREYHPKSKGE